VRLRDLLGDSGPLDATLTGGTQPVEYRGDPDVEITSVAYDSRNLRAGALFACIRGRTTDGHDHAPAAVGAGARALLVERWLDLPVPQIKVPSVRAAVGPVAAFVEGEPSRSLPVVGVTGTNGKTTTTLLLEQVFDAAGLRPGVVGTLGVRIGGVEHPSARTTPEAPDLQRVFATMRAAQVDAIAMEVSSHALVQHRVDGTFFAAAVFTNLTHEHLDYHGTLEEYFAAKLLLFAPRFTNVAVINVDDDSGPRLVEQAAAQGLEVVTFGEAPEADVTVENVASDRQGSRMTLRTADGARAPVRLQLAGSWNRSNALAAAAAALVPAVGIALDAVAEGLSRPVVVPGRFERVSTHEAFDVFVDYAHTPDALAGVLETARELADGRVVVVFGCGGDRDRDKRPAMGAAAARLADEVVVTSDNPRSEDPALIAREAAEGVRAAGGEPIVELDRRTAIERGLDAARPGDVVVIAGKGHERGQEINGSVIPFDDREVARALLGALR